MLAEKLRALGKDERVQGKGKGREVLLRYEGEVIEGEHPAVVRDPRKESKVKRAVCLRPGRSELLPLKYEVRGDFLLIDCLLTGNGAVTSMMRTQWVHHRRRPYLC